MNQEYGKTAQKEIQLKKNCLQGALFSFNGHAASTKKHRMCLEASAQKRKMDSLTFFSSTSPFIYSLQTG